MRCKKTGGRRHPFTTARNYLDAYLQPRHVRLRTSREGHIQRIYLPGPKTSELCQRAGMRCVRDKRNQGARAGLPSIDNAMKSMGPSAKEAVLARIRWHVRMQPSDTRLRRVLSRGKPSMTMPCIRR